MSSQSEESAEDANTLRLVETLEYDLICPITHALPREPVVAEDGRVYERSAMRTYFKTKPGASKIRSPLCGRMIGKRLLPVPQIKNIVQTLMENGVIERDFGYKWEEEEVEKTEKEEMEDLLKKAREGDVKAMQWLGSYYYFGQNGFKQDFKTSLMWLERACNAGSLYGMAVAGRMLTVGCPGVRKDPTKGLMYLCMAEGRGSDFAAAVLGLCFAGGLHSAPMDKTMARQLLEKSLRGTYLHKQLKGDLKCLAQQKLLELMKEV